MNEPTTTPTPCLHPAKRKCAYCLERYCPNAGCDQYHVENCREAMRP